MPKRVFTGKTVIPLKPGDIIEDCRYHPCVVLDVNQDDLGDDDEIHMRSLITGSTGYCSAQYCGVRLISQGELAAWEEYGPRSGEALVAYWSALPNT